MIPLLPFLLSLLSFISISAALPLTQQHSNRQSNPACPTVLPIHASITPRIVGGDVANPFLQSHLVSFFDYGCGGSLISPTWVLTAGHCFIAPGATAFLGGSTFDNGFPIQVKAVYNHSEYSFPKNDILLVELDEPAPSQFRSVLINANPATPRTAEFTRAVGYGFTDEAQSNNRDGILRQVDLPVVTTKSCKQAYKDSSSHLAPDINTPLHICAGYDEGGCDSCLADSGGPLFVYDPDNNPVQIAIVSFGYGCARPGLAGGYTRVTEYIDWMKSVGAVFQISNINTPVFAPSPTSSPPTAPTSPTPFPVTASPTTTTSLPTTTQPTTSVSRTTRTRPSNTRTAIIPRPTAPIVTTIPPTTSTTAPPRVTTTTSRSTSSTSQSTPSTSTSTDRTTQPATTDRTTQPATTDRTTQPSTTDRTTQPSTTKPAAVPTSTAGTSPPPSSAGPTTTTTTQTTTQATTQATTQTTTQTTTQATAQATTQTTTTSVASPVTGASEPVPEVTPGELLPTPDDSQNSDNGNTDVKADGPEGGGGMNGGAIAGLSVGIIAAIAAVAGLGYWYRARVIAAAAPSSARATVGAEV